jgi:accessory gene regulator B
MKKFILDKCINIVKQNNNYDETKLAEIRYGLEGIYLTITKIIIISTLSIILGIFKEFLIFLGIYTIIRTTSFGLHASKSWICLITSTIFFIGFPLLSIYTTLNITLKITIGIISTIGIFLFSPADTVKRPIINKTRRKIYKILSTIISIIYLILSIKIKNNYISNSLIYSTILQNILISPITYKLFNMPYNNYKTYKKNMV